MKKHVAPILALAGLIAGAGASPADELEQVPPVTHQATRDEQTRSVDLLHCGNRIAETLVRPDDSDGEQRSLHNGSVSTR